MKLTNDEISIGSKMNADKKLTSLSQFVDQEYGLKGTSKRDQFETEYENFKEEIFIQQVIQEKKIDTVGD